VKARADAVDQKRDDDRSSAGGRPMHTKLDWRRVGVRSKQTKTSYFDGSKQLAHRGLQARSTTATGVLQAASKRAVGLGWLV